MIVREIESEDTLNIRNLILRPGKAVSECRFHGDEDDHTFHLGAFVKRQLVSIASFYLEKNEKFSDTTQYRLRGMATLDDFRRKGYSASLIQTGIPTIKSNQASLIWCNARTNAVGFYEKIGFEKCSEEFTIKDVGPHYLMKMDLK